MVSEDAQLVIGFVEKEPGIYSPTDLITRLRRYRIDDGSGDPGLANARNSFQEALKTGHIEVRNEGVSLGVKMERVYPKS